MGFVGVCGVEEGSGVFLFCKWEIVWDVRGMSSLKERGINI